jgi:hypothetical protein
MLAQANISKVLKTLLMWPIISNRQSLISHEVSIVNKEVTHRKNQSTKLTKFKGRLWVSYIFGSNEDFEERKSSIEILTKVELGSFYKPMVLGCLKVGEVFLKNLWGG